MKQKINIKDKLLSKHPNLKVKQENGEYIVFLPNKAGFFTVGHGKDEQGAWKSAGAFYNEK